MRRISLFTIPAGAAFADELARGVLARFSDAHDPFVLSRVLILLPTRRAIRTLSDAFVRVSARAVTVLPRMRALGDFDDAPSLLDDGEGDDLASESVATLAPPMLALRREFLLTKLVQRWSESEERRALGTTTPALALKLARDLIALLDQATAEGLAWERLEDLVPDELSQHWEQTLTFLKILTQEWPRLLAAEFASDPSTHRDAALRRAAEMWRAAPPDHPIVAAGSTGSVPATAELLKTIAFMPKGAVVLPGIDLTLDADAWEATEAGHPQHGMRQLLARMDATRSDVEPWGSGEEPRSARVRLIAEALRPAETTPAWRDFVSEKQAQIAEGLRGLSTLVARTQAEEALAIALAMREAVETPDKTAALVTPDRSLARRVVGELKRWGIAIDDSAGTPLAHTLAGRFLCLIADAAAEEFAPVPLLALLKHPMTALWFDERSEARRLAAELEIEVLRGLRPAPGLEGLRRIVDPKLPSAELVRRLETGYGPLASALTEGSHDLRVLARWHREAAEMLSALADPAEQPLWDKEAGEAAAELFAAIDEASLDAGLEMSGPDYAAFIREVMETVPVRPHIGRHARLSILGPLEVRLQHADLMILGGLNEGVWPPATDPGPWLNRPMRRALDLSQPERRVGLSAHDFAQAAACPEVLLTRAEKDAGAPTTPSRWLTRLTMLVEGAGLIERLRDARLLDLARAIDRPAAMPALKPPAPRPPVSARPRTLPVTQVELWVRDPYALYAKKILGLRRLDPIDATPAAPERGSAVHTALETFVKMYPAKLPADAEALDALMTCGRAAFGELLERPGVRGFWWPRYERIAKWFLTFEHERRAHAVQVLAEQHGEMTLEAPAGPFTLTAKADRIEIYPDDVVVLADYKTGASPSAKQVMSGLSPQLTLEAAIALAGGFRGVTAFSIGELLYVELKGGVAAGAAKPIDFKDQTPDGEAMAAKAGLARFVAAFDAPDMPYLSKPRVLLERFAGDYDHLARVKEWSSGGEE